MEEIVRKGWHGEAQFALFSRYDKPHWSITTRCDVGALCEAAGAGRASIYRGTLWAITAAAHDVLAMRLRFAGERIYRHENIRGSMTVPMPAGGYGYGYIGHHADYAGFDKACRAEIARERSGDASPPNTGQSDDLIYLSCLPWLDFTALDNALPGPDDCIPRVSWGRVVEAQGRRDMAMTLQVHHALVDGEAAGAFFAAVQSRLDRFASSGR